MNQLVYSWGTKWCSLSRLCAALACLAALCASGNALAYDVYPAQAAQGTITNDSTCNLADALDSIRLGTPSHGCTGPASGTITLHATSASVTYHLDNTVNITNGNWLWTELGSPSYVVTIRGYMTGDMFAVSSTGSLNLNNLTIRHNSGTGRHINNQGGSIDASYCTFTNGGTATTFGNVFHGGSIYNLYGTVSVSNCTFTGNQGYYGGAILHYGDTTYMTVSSCVFTNNRALYGGGAIATRGAAGTDIYTSTFSTNTGDYEGGAIDSWGRLRISISTISGNKSTFGPGGGIKVNSGGNNYLEVFYTTIAFNHADWEGGGVDTLGSGATTLIGHSIVAKNTYSSSNTPSDYHGDPQTEQVVKSLFGVSTGIVNLSAVNIIGDPKLAALSANGVTSLPILKTHRIASNSPAKDVVGYQDNSTSGLSLDERGWGRPCVASGGLCDLGSFERVASDP